MQSRAGAKGYVSRARDGVGFKTRPILKALWSDSSAREHDYALIHRVGVSLHGPREQNIRLSNPYRFIGLLVR